MNKLWLVERMYNKSYLMERGMYQAPCNLCRHYTGCQLHWNLEVQYGKCYEPTIGMYIDMLTDIRGAIDSGLKAWRALTVEEQSCADMPEVLRKRIQASISSRKDKVSAELMESYEMLDCLEGTNAVTKGEHDGRATGAM